MYPIEKVWSDWKIVKLIGEGSFGKVYEIVRNNYNIEEHSAMKVVQIPNSNAEVQSLKNEGIDQGSLREYYLSLVDDFSREIAVMAKLKGNPGIVAYEDYRVIEHEDGLGWDIIIRMELLNPLASIMSQRELTEQEVIDLGVSLCDALSVCHKNNIIHRDIKIDNIFVSDTGFYKLGDFGVARTIEKTSAALSKKGTYTYMAPEVYRGEPYGQRADIYSLGMVMYRLLNYNREPFLPPPPEPVKYNDKNNALTMRMRGDRFDPPAKAGAALQAVIMKACEFNAANRFASAEEMKQALLQVRANPNTVPVFASYNTPPILTPPQPPKNLPPGSYEGFDPRNYYIAPPAPPRAKSYSKAGTALGWVGIAVNILCIIFVYYRLYMVPTLLISIIIGAMTVLAVMQILLSFKLYNKGVWITAFAASIFSLSIINIISTTLFYSDCFTNPNLPPT